MTEKKYYCWYGRHDTVESAFSQAYLTATYNGGGRICKKCAKKKYEERKKKRQEDFKFFKIIG